MKTTRVSATRTGSTAKLATSSVVNMPTFSSPLKGVVDSVSKNGTATIKTSRGNIRLVSEAPLKVGQNVVAALTNDKSELHLQILTKIASGGPVEGVTNDLPEGKADFYTFKVPGRFRGQLVDPTNSHSYSTSPSSSISSNASTQHVEIDSQGIIQFLSYANRGGLSDTYCRAIQNNAELINLFPHLGNLISSLSAFLKNLQNGTFSKDLPERLGMDVENLSSISKFLSNDEWSFFLVPINDGQKLLPAKIFVSESVDSEEKDFSSKKFQVDLDMDVLGPILIDGLLIQKNGITTLNMSVKTSTPLDTSLEQDIRTLFEISADALSPEGNAIQFQQLEQNQPSRLTECLHNYCKDRIKNFWA